MRQTPSRIDTYDEPAQPLRDPLASGDAGPVSERPIRLSPALQDGLATIESVSLLGADERAQILDTFNATARPYPRDQSLVSRFEAQAVQTPQAVAVRDGTRSWRFHELNTCANRLARTLRAQHGVRLGDRVGVMASRSAQTIVAMLAVLKAGAAYLPLDPLYPAKRLEAMVRIVAPRLLLLDSSHRDKLLGCDRPMLLIDRHLDIATGDTSNLPEPPDATALAYVMFTSGSTGEPKGVMVSHRAILRLTVGADFLQVGRDDRFLQLSSLSFDAATHEIWAPLLNGGTLVMVPADVLGQPQRLKDLLLHEAVTCAFVTTGLFNQLIDVDAGFFASLRCVLTGGERLSARHAQAALAASPGLALVHAYGPTENTAYTTCHRIEAADGLVDIPIGRPIANTRAYVVGRHGDLKPVGVIGEICAAGDGLADGYFGDPALTAARFVPCGFTTGTMYRTGDLGYWRPDGALVFVGRVDGQLKVRGFRVETGEIEARLRELAGVRQVCVVARAGEEGTGAAPAGERRLVAYVVAADDAAPPTPGEMRTHLAAVLPAFMLPTAFVRLGALPLTPNGKVDRQALPAPGRNDLVETPYEAPAGPLETSIALAWQALLGVERVGRHDQFFQLGGHSLLAIRLLARLRQELGCELPLRALFDHPTLAAFATAVDAEGRTSRAATVDAVCPRADRSRDLPLSAAQQRLWFVDRLDRAAGAAYHLPLVFRLRGRLNRDALRASFDRLLHRHESLRTCFVEPGDGPPVQRIDAPDVGFAWAEHDLTDEPSTEREAKAMRSLRTAAAAPFDLSRGPLIRGSLARLASNDHLLLVCQHHIVSDGWSMGVLRREIGALYGAFAAGRADPLPPLSLQYADHAAAERRALQGELLHARIAFWRQHLADAPVLLNLPTDRSRPPIASYAGDSLPVCLSPDLTGRLRELAGQQGLTVFMVLLAAWAALLARLSGQADLVVGTPVANRPRAELEPLIGFFVNTLALRLNVPLQADRSRWFEQVRAVTLDAQAHQDLPFEQVVEAVSPPRSASHHPLFQALLAYDNTPDAGPLALPGVVVDPVDLELPTSQFDLALSLHDEGGGVNGRLGFATALFDRATVAHWRDSFLTLLTALVDPAHATTPIGRLPLLDAAGRSQQLAHGSGPLIGSRHRDSIPLRFEAQAATTPDALAVRAADGGGWTYAELAQRANRIAWRLRALGVGANDRVAVCLRRSPDLLAAILGVLKAGAAYVPIDLGYPNERLAFMLTDCAPAAVLTRTADAAALPTTAPVVAVDAPSDSPTGNPPAAACADDHLAYVIYTSGSTGRPKAAQVVHRGLNNLLDWYLDDLVQGADDSVLIPTSHSFDLTQKNLLGPLLLGAAVHLAAEPFSPRDILAQIGAHDIRCINLTPSAFQALVDADVSHTLCRLRRVVLGGEPIQVSVLARLPEPRPEFINSYGPTECSDVATCHRLEPDLSRYARGVPLGAPIRGTTLQVLDTYLQPVPRGVVGELCIGGSGVGPGYLGRPDLTAGRFVTDPDRPGERLYRTGDLVRWRADGELDYLGRNDFQVKIRGFRIELGEIEARLATGPGVREAVVCAREAAPGDTRLVAYVVAADRSAPPTPADLRAHLATTLPDFMLPSAFVQLDALPSSPNGKVDRSALPAPTRAALAQRGFEAPRSATERAMASMWQTLLAVDRVGRHDDFFQLGGHSLLAVQLLARLRSDLGAMPALFDLFRFPTVAALSAHLDAARPAPASRKGSTRPAARLVALRGDGDLPPLICFPGAAADAAAFSALTRRLPANQPVFAVQLPAHGSGSGSVQALAAAALPALRAQSHDGPYRLLGHSFGGWLAFECALHLQREGAGVSRLFLLDTRAPLRQGADRHDTHVSHVADWVTMHEQQFGFDCGLRFRDAAATEPTSVLETLFGALSRHGIQPYADPAALREAYFAYERLAQVDYRPARRFAGTLDLLLAADAPDGSRIDASGWTPHAAEVRQAGCSGNHQTMLSASNVRGLADRLASRLGRS